MDEQELVARAIFLTIAVAVTVFSVVAWIIMGPVRKLRPGEKILLVFGVIGAVAALILAILQLFYEFLI